MKPFTKLLVMCVLAFGLLSLCLSGPAEAQSSLEFDHDLTRFPLIGKHEIADCESCHIGGQFLGTPTACQSCHGSAGARSATRPSPAHIPVQTGCEDCHSPRFWEPARMDHSAVGFNCESCHVGRMAVTKSANHIQSSNQCGDCHGTVRWESARFSHSGVSGNCFSCHNGSIAEGKNPGHIASNNDCELCHSTRRWTPATGFDHSGVSPGTCNSCHNGSVATGLPSRHFSTSLSCDACHNTRDWEPAEFDHAGVAYPGDHREELDCQECHGGNSQQVTWSAPAYQPDCAGCHARDYERDKDDHGNRSVSENRNCAASGCHSVRDPDWDD